MFLLQSLYEYVFVNGQVDNPFGLFTSCPRRLLPINETYCSTTSSQLLSVEFGDDLVDLVELEVGNENYIQNTIDQCTIFYQGRIDRFGGRGHVTQHQSTYSSKLQVKTNAE